MCRAANALHSVGLKGLEVVLNRSPSDCRTALRIGPIPYPRTILRIRSTRSATTADRPRRAETSVGTRDLRQITSAIRDEPSYMMSMKKTTQSIVAKILSRIRSKGKGSVHVPGDFLDLGSREAVDLALHRFVKNGTLRRLARGVYDLPEQHPVLGLLSPSADSIAEALAGRDHARLQSAGAYAANALGLSEQVPAKAVFLTDGASRTVRIGPMTIQLRRTTPRNMAAAGRHSGLVIQAFRELGKKHVTEARIERLKRTLPADKRRELLKDLKLAPAWMHPIFRALAEEAS